MRYLFIFLLVLVSCKSERKEEITIDSTTPDTIVEPRTQEPNTQITEPSSAKPYSNARFRSVTSTKVAENKYLVEGQGQIFEASFSWVVEDGHNELKSGHEMTDAGAPDWGNFSFTIEVEKEEENSTLTLILYEISAKDGSRQHELAIPLE